MDREKLKPCPFCGGEARAYLKISLAADEPEKLVVTARVQCSGCWAEVPGVAVVGRPMPLGMVPDVSGNDAIRRAVAAWNRRT